MWWNKKKEHIETEGEKQIRKALKEKKKRLSVAKDKAFDEILTAVNNEDVDLAKKWIDFYDRLERYKYE